MIGAGDAASTLLHEVFKSNNRDMNVVCCVDDAPEKVGRRIMGVEIMGTTEDIPELVERCDIERPSCFAIPTLDEAGKRRILRICNKTKCNVRILPDIVKLISGGKDLLSRVRDVRVEDVLGRDEIELSNYSSALVNNKVVMVTGGGSIGSELCRQNCRQRAAKLIIVDIYENSAYSIQQELRRKYGGARWKWMCALPRCAIPQNGRAVCPLPPAGGVPRGGPCMCP